MTHYRDGQVLGKRATEHTIIIASGTRVRHMTIKPWGMALMAGLLCVFVVGYFVGTTYLILRDDLIGATMARQARMQHAYEDRIAALRAQVDRITSRQMIDQQLMEDKLAKLVADQAALTSRHGRLGQLLERAEQNSVLPAEAPLPAARPSPEERAAHDTPLDAISRITTGTVAALPMRDSSRALGYAPSIQSPSDQADHAFSAVTFALRTIEREQLSRIETLTGNALSNAESIEDALASVGMRVAAGSETHAGGPYLPALTGEEAAAPSGRFETSLDALDQALLRLETVRDHALVAPLGHPVPGHGMTSRFGNRTDPFLRRPAFHAGLDFRSPTGTAVQAAGNGTVSFAGRSGGYGNMVEIRHGDGLTTRYAHLSRIFVSSGDAIVAGQRIGAAGSTGRSTGPHLHYEVRRDGKPIDPIRFLRAGEQVAPLLVSR